MDGIGVVRLDVERSRHRPVLGEGRAEAALHHAGPQVGHTGPAGRVRGQGVLRLVRCSHWLREHHGLLHGPMGALVEEQSTGDVLRVYGQGQRAVPFGRVPCHAAGHSGPLHSGQPPDGHR